MRKLGVALVSAFLSLSMCITSFAAGVRINITEQDINNESGMIADCDCSYCKKIEEFFAGERDAQKRELSVQVWKASIHPELFVDAGSAVYVGTFPNAENLQFTVITLGLDVGWPRHRVENGNLKVYMPPKRGPGIKDNMLCVDKIYESVQEVKEQIDRDNSDVLATLYSYYQNKFEYSLDTVDGHPISKLSTVYKTGKACCTGMSTAYKIAANMCGQDVRYVGNEDHMFLETTIDGVNKYIDLAGVDSGWHYFLFGEDMLSGVHRITRR